MLGLMYFALSTLAAGLVCFNAWEDYVQFYPIAVHLSTNKTSVLVMGNFGFAVTLVLARATQTLFFGNVGAEETREITEKTKFAILDTCLALTTFRSSLNFTVVCLFTVLLFSKIFHWLAYMRVEATERQRLPFARLLRIGLPLKCLLMSDCFFVVVLTWIVWQSGQVDVLVLFAFEWAILFCAVSFNSFKFWLGTIDTFLNGNFPNKPFWLFLGEFVYGLIQLLLYIAFFGVITMELNTFPLHLLRSMFLNFVYLQQMLVRFFKYRAILRTLETRFPTVNFEGQENQDVTCTICMADIAVGKRLPCGHVFHTACLKEWFRQNPICPTCRHPVDDVAPARNAAPGNIGAPPAPVNPNQAAAPPAPAAANPAAPNPVPNAVPRAPAPPGEVLGGVGQPPAPLNANQEGQPPEARNRAPWNIPNAGPSLNFRAAFADNARLRGPAIQRGPGVRLLVAPAPALPTNPKDGLRQLEDYTLAVQHQKELHQVYLSHLMSLEHHLLDLQTRWTDEQARQPDPPSSEHKEADKDKDEEKEDVPEPPVPQPGAGGD